ncbi:MAG: hypothetical protein FJ150_06460 [Euryarchaeota archaeon]|nr:hypothetical protein [Euryarchaeota archaeon]
MIFVTSVVTTTTTTITTIEIIVWVLTVLILSFIVSFLVTYTKCESYRCSIKYSLLTGAIIGIMYGIIVWQLIIIPQFTEISLNPSPAYIRTHFYFFFVYVTSEVLVNMVVGLFGGSISVTLKKKIQ